jgi:GNAT superfamily N-acetyltransferase
MGAATKTIRRATETDLPALTKMLGRAFAQDPVVLWACRTIELRPALLEAIASARLRQSLSYEEIWMTDESTSTAVWTPPGRGETNPLQNIALACGLLRPRMLGCLPRLALGLTYMQRMHPREPRHWYLARLGTDPSEQGRGLGSAVLQPVLELCDSDRVGAYLETALHRNLSFYARHSFQVSGELRLPRGPTIWSMWREPHEVRRRPIEELRNVSPRGTAVTSLQIPPQQSPQRKPCGGDSDTALGGELARSPYVEVRTCLAVRGAGRAGAAVGPPRTGRTSMLGHRA